jgi:uncharacterized protein (TIGR03032 family)
VTWWPVPHPSGLAVDRARGRVHLASTRNPNRVWEFAPVAGTDGRPVLFPRRSVVLPGRLYLHDLAFIGGALHGNAVGLNAVVRFDDRGAWRPVWWPRCVERRGRPDFSRNHLQLNSIAAGRSAGASCFSASGDRILPRKPGDPRYPVDGRGVIFSGRTRRAMCAGLTRPHSARLYRRRVWVDNSGYGEVGYADRGRLRVVARLPGWTRGLCFAGGVGFAGTSRVIPRFRAYAPGVAVRGSVCGVHAFDPAGGRVLASLRWPAGNQIFAIDRLPVRAAAGLPCGAGAGEDDVRRLCYAFRER